MRLSRRWSTSAKGVIVALLALYRKAINRSRKQQKPFTLVCMFLDGDVSPELIRTWVQVYNRMAEAERRKAGGRYGRGVDARNRQIGYISALPPLVARIEADGEAEILSSGLIHERKRRRPTPWAIRDPQTGRFIARSKTDSGNL